MKFLATVAVIATSVNARCDFDLTKPFKYYTRYSNGKAKYTNTLDDGTRTIINTGDKDYLWATYYKLKPDVDPNRDHISCDFRKISMKNTSSWVQVGYYGSDTAYGGDWGN
jgi:hypothetical protein